MYLNTVFVIVALLLSPLWANDLSLLDFYSHLSQAGKVDLTHTFNPTIPHFGGFSPMTWAPLFTYADGFYVQTFCHVGQWGTHIDPPSHFHQGLRTVEDIPVNEFFLPLVVIDVSSKVAANADYTLQMIDIEDWENRNGLIPAGSFVAMRTDWSTRWPSDEAMKNRDENGTFHYPGWSHETLSFLYETRNIWANGHEPTDTDTGTKVSAGNFSCESYVLGTDHYQIEMLTQLSQVPEKGALILVSVPKIAHGSGFPARVISFLPPADNTTLLWDYYDNVVSKKKFVDLTHAFDNNTPHWKGFSEMNRTIIYDYDVGFRAEIFCHVGQWGTHVDPPAHFIEGLRLVDELTLDEMVFPLIVLDVSSKVTLNADYQVTMDDVRAWESRYGQAIPSHSFTLLRTDWADRWPNNSAMYNLDANGTAHYPGWSQEVLTYLFETRNITACGHEQTDTDYGLDTSQNKYLLETYVLSTNHYQIELVASSRDIPAYGAVAFISFPKIEEGSGFPARAFAIVPDSDPVTTTTTSSSSSSTSTTGDVEESSAISVFSFASLFVWVLVLCCWL